MTPDQIEQALRWGPLTPERIRKAQRHAPADVVARVVEKIRTDAAQRASLPPDDGKRRRLTRKMGIRRRGNTVWRVILDPDG